MTQAPLIEVRGLSIAYRAGRETVEALHAADLTIRPGEVVAIVGESGSGKSTLANALIGLLPEQARILSGTIRCAGEDVTRASEAQWRKLRGGFVGLVPQDPALSLNPTMTISRQIGEAARLANPVASGAEIAAEVEALIAQVGLDRPQLRARQYPHELSGGMRQRALIAMALAGRPRLVIADEPTSALDATVQKKILDHLEVLVKQRGAALLIITHDLGVAADRADHVLVMETGRVVEQGPTAEVLRAPKQPYTQALLAAAPGFRRRPAEAAAPAGAPPPQEVLRFEAVGKSFGGGAPSRLDAWLGRAPKPGFVAVEGASFQVHAGRTLAIVGESGSGKTTLLRIALGLEKPTAGRVIFEGRDLTKLSWSEFRPLRRRIQLVQQNPSAALDPRHTAFESVVEPLRSFGAARGVDLEAVARRLADQVRLPRAALGRLPRELSGGQRQRVAIARALALSPEILFLDEPVSALDVSVQARILDLLAELQRDLGVSYVFVSHDLSVVSAIAHEVLVLRRGRVEEIGPTAQVFGAPRSAFTRELLEAVPGGSSHLQQVQEVFA